MQLAFDLQINASQPTITIECPYSFSGRLRVIETYRLQFEARDIAKYTGMKINEVKKLAGFLDGLTETAIAAIHEGNVIESVASALLKLTPEQQDQVCELRGKITKKDVDLVLNQNREELVADLPDDLFLPDFEWEQSPAEAQPATTLGDRDALIQSIVRVLSRLSDEELHSLIGTLKVPAS